MRTSRHCWWDLGECEDASDTAEKRAGSLAVLGDQQQSPTMTSLSSRSGTGKSLVLQVALRRVTLRMAAAKEGGVPASASAALATLGHGLPFVAVHINGYTIADDHSAVREISAQLAIDPEAATAAAEAEADATAAADAAAGAASGKPAPRKRGRPAAETRVKRRTVAHACVRSHRQTFEQHLAFVTATLRDGKLAGTPVVLVIDEFDVFCARTKQSLLYNLLDLTQDAS